MATAYIAASFPNEASLLREAALAVFSKLPIDQAVGLQFYMVRNTGLSAVGFDPVVTLIETIIEAVILSCYHKNATQMLKVADRALHAAFPFCTIRRLQVEFAVSHAVSQAIRSTNLRGGLKFQMFPNLFPNSLDFSESMIEEIAYAMISAAGDADEHLVERVVVAVREQKEAR